MAEFINSVDVLGDDALVDMIINRTIEEYRDDAITTVGYDAFKKSRTLTSVDCPMATIIEQYAFDACDALANVNIPSATALKYCAFRNCNNLNRVDLPAVTSVEYGVFQNCSNLETLILREQQVAYLSSTGAFSGTKIASGTSYIYVPAALVDSYKAATNWSTYAAQFRAIEDYPDICG